MSIRLPAAKRCRREPATPKPSQAKAGSGDERCRPRFVESACGPPQFRGHGTRSGESVFPDRALQHLDYETPPVPCRTQNSSNRVRPDTPSKAPDASSHRAKGRPDMYATIPPNTAPPAATGATTLPIQLMKLKNAPSGWAPDWP